MSILELLGVVFLIVIIINITIGIWAIKAALLGKDELKFTHNSN